MKSIVILFLLSTTLFSFGQNFIIDTISENSPFFPGDVYCFPILKGNDKEVSKKINSHLIKDFLRIEYGKENNSVFENIWGNIEEPMPVLTDLIFTTKVINDRIYFLEFNAWWCRAYCEGITQRYNYDLKNGNYIGLDTLINSLSHTFVLNYLTNNKKRIIKKQLNFISKKIDIDSFREDDYYRNIRVKSSYDECLEYSDFDSFVYFDFYIKNDSVILTSRKCSSHYDKDLGEIRDFVYKFKITDIKKYLSPYGKEILL